MKKIICISGNCVTEQIPLFLKTNRIFNSRFEIKVLKPVFMMTYADVPNFVKDVSQCDIFLTQPIVGIEYKNMGIDTNTLKRVLKPKARLIIMPVPYFTGYFPEQFYLHDEKGTMVGECDGLPAPYNNKIIFYGYVNGKSVQETFDMLVGDGQLLDAAGAVKESIEELQKREQSTDFGISRYIINNFKEKRLFWTINHPTNDMLRYISDQILRLLGVGFLGVGSRVKNINGELLDSYITPILPYAQKQLNLQFDTPEQYTSEYIQACYDYYDKHPDLVQSNKEVLIKVMR